MTVAPTAGLEDLKEVIDAYNKLAERLQASQAALQCEVARLREELAEKNRQLATKNRLEVLGEMAAGVAHEIRNPLGGIELYAGLIARERRDDAKVSNWATKIQSATQHMSRTLGEILDFTRPLKPALKPVLLDDVVDVALDLASSAVEGRAVRVLRESPRRRAVVMGDHNLLQRAFLNVILNAVEAMESGGTLTTRVLSAKLGNTTAWRIEFADTGDGINPEDIEKVFNPFFTRKEGGTGLGLAMVSRIVSAHDGRLSAGNAARGGAVFAFTLPAGEFEGEK